MGYRTYLGIIKKTQLEDLLSCKTCGDLCDVYKKYNWDYSCEEEDGNAWWYFPVYGLDYRAKFEFGKYASLGDEFDNELHEIFPEDHPLHSKFEEHDFWYGDEKLFLAAIENYRHKVRDYFEDLLKESPKEDSWESYEYRILSDKEKANWRNQRILTEIADKAREWGDEKCLQWKLFPYNLNKENDHIVESWLYEYEVFELVRLYKTFDQETEALIYYGF